MRVNFVFLLLLPVFSLCSCRSINHDNTETKRPHALVYLSFDDGPNSQGDTSARLLDVLARYRVSALFSLLGVNAEHNPDLVRRIYDEGHYIVNHGYSEKFSYRMSDTEFRNNLLRGEAAISAALGKDLYPKLYRPQGGFYFSRQETIWRKEGYTLFPGTIRIYDTRLTAAEREKAVKRVLKKTEQQGGGIILLHDGMNSHYAMKKELEKNPAGIYNRSWIPAAVEEIIIELKSKGYILGDPNTLTLKDF
jgi:peptidoglycan/xylan/chitin deacetylase (PgdA/CDA1 family)